MEKIIRVKMAELAVAKAPAVLVTIGLGSCVGVAIYDPINKIGGLIHLMLPEYTKGLNYAKYVDTGLPLLIKNMLKLGANKQGMFAKIVGGAHMFRLANFNSSFKVGEKNVQAVLKNLAKEKIQVIGQDVGLDYGRTMEFSLDTGQVLVRAYNKETICL